MRPIWILIFCISGWTTKAQAAWLLDRAYSVVQASGFNPAKILQEKTGLKVSGCQFSGKAMQVISDDMGRCLFYAFFDLYESGQASPVKMQIESLKSGKILTAEATLRWADFRIDRNGWRNWLPSIFLFYRYQEIKIFLNAIVQNDIYIDFSEPLSLNDLSILKDPLLNRHFSQLSMDQIVLSSFPRVESGTLSGMLELKDRTKAATVAKIFFLTNWKLFSKTPIKSRIKGNINPVRRLPSSFLESPADSSCLDSGKDNVDQYLNTKLSELEIKADAIPELLIVKQDIQVEVNVNGVARNIYLEGFLRVPAGRFRLIPGLGLNLELTKNNLLYVCLRMQGDHPGNFIRLIHLHRKGIFQRRYDVSPAPLTLRPLGEGELLFSKLLQSLNVTEDSDQSMTVEQESLLQGVLKRFFKLGVEQADIHPDFFEITTVSEVLNTFRLSRVSHKFPYNSPWLTSIK